jgi:hypothetical protein
MVPSAAASDPVGKSCTPLACLLDNPTRFEAFAHLVSFCEALCKDLPPESFVQNAHVSSIDASNPLFFIC